MCGVELVYVFCVFRMLRRIARVSMARARGMVGALLVSSRGESLMRACDMNHLDMADGRGGINSPQHYRDCYILQAARTETICRFGVVDFGIAWDHYLSLATANSDSSSIQFNRLYVN